MWMCALAPKIVMPANGISESLVVHMPTELANTTGKATLNLPWYERKIAAPAAALKKMWMK